MKKDDLTKQEMSRRTLLASVSAGAAAATAGNLLATAASAAPMRPHAELPRRSAGGPYNILFILTDQERFFRPGELPQGYRLTAHERLAQRGVVFENHRIASCVCTSSRSVIYTGRHIQQTKLFDNTNFPWSNSLSPEIKTIGHLMREAGYYSAYKGKWHMTKEFETVNELGHPTKFFTKEMEAYGFSDYFGIGDIIAHTNGGYLHDQVTAAMTVNWLRGRGTDLAGQNKPWFLAVNIVNPHDIMFLNTDRPGQPVQEKNILGHINQPPSEPYFSKQWAFNLPASHSQRIDAPGRPAAHGEYIRSHDGLTGNIANEDWRWKKRHNYYLNCLRDADRNITTILDELERQGLASKTIVVLTADHGDLDGAHGLHAKGATAYREQNQVPLIISHPGYAGGRRCRAVTSHLDLVPTLIGMTNASPERKAAITKGLVGKDLSAVLGAPETAGASAVRDGALFCFNMFAYIDGEFITKARALLERPGGKAKLGENLKASGLKMDLTKRGAIRSIYDGRYTFARYYAPKQHNRPTSLEALFKLNDVELFDLQADPHEVKNLALDPKKNGNLLEAMNAKLNAVIDREVGEDVGQMLPGGVDGGWVATDAAKDV